MFDPLQLLYQSLPWATTLSLIALGEMMLERSGLVNLGLEGMLYFSASLASLFSLYYGSPYYGIVGGILGGVLLATIYVVAVIFLKADQIVVGLTIVFLGIGVGDLVGNIIGGLLAPSFTRVSTRLVFPFFSLLLVPVLLYYILYHSWYGYAIRAVGEDIHKSYTLGIPVTKIRVLMALLGGIFSGIAGSYFILGPLAGRWTAGRTLGWGWIALGIVILGYWHPLGIVIASVILSLLYTYRPLLQAWGVPAAFSDAVPYIAVILSLIGVSWLYNKLGVKPPAAVWVR